MTNTPQGPASAPPSNPRPAHVSVALLAVPTELNLQGFLFQGVFVLVLWF